MISTRSLASAMQSYNECPRLTGSPISERLSNVATPKFSHSYAAHHPTYRFNEVRVPAAQRVGQPGDGMAYTHSWFRHERLMIGARSCGAAARLIEEARAFADTRFVDGAPLSEKQAIQFMLADSVTELWASRLMTYAAARACDRGDDLKMQHSRCSMDLNNKMI